MEQTKATSQADRLRALIDAECKRVGKPLDKLVAVTEEGALYVAPSLQKIFNAATAAGYIHTAAEYFAENPNTYGYHKNEYVPTLLNLTLPFGKEFDLIAMNLKHEESGHFAIEQRKVWHEIGHSIVKRGSGESYTSNLSEAAAQSYEILRYAQVHGVTEDFWKNETEEQASLLAFDGTTRYYNPDVLQKLREVCEKTDVKSLTAEETRKLAAKIARDYYTPLERVRDLYMIFYEAHSEFRHRFTTSESMQKTLDRIAEKHKDNDYVGQVVRGVSGEISNRPDIQPHRRSLSMLKKDIRHALRL